MFRIESFPHDNQSLSKPMKVNQGSSTMQSVSGGIKSADVTIHVCPATLLKEGSSSLYSGEKGVICTIGRKNSTITFESDKCVSRQHCTIRMVVSPKSSLLSSSSDIVKNEWFAPQTEEETEACSEGVALVVTDLGSRYGTFIMKQHQQPAATIDKGDADNTDTDTDNEAEAPMSLCFNANKAISDFNDGGKTAVEQVNLFEHTKLSANKSYPLVFSSQNDDNIIWIQCGVSGSLVRVTFSTAADETNASKIPNNKSGENRLGKEETEEIMTLTAQKSGEKTLEMEETDEIMPLINKKSSEKSLEKEEIVQQQQLLNQRPTKRLKTNAAESQWQSRISSRRTERQLSSDDANENYETNVGIDSPASAVILPNDSKIETDESFKARKKLPSPTKEGWLAIAPHKDRAAFRRVDIDDLRKEAGMEEALTEFRTDLIVVQENKVLQNQRQMNKKNCRENNFKRFRKNFVLKGLNDEEDVVLTAVLPKETARQHQKELTQQQIEEEELFVDTLFNPKGKRNLVPNRRRNK